MRIEIKNSFMNPRTNSMAKKGEIFNVPKNQFWLRRLAEEDIEKTKKDKTEKREEVKTNSKEVGKPARAGVPKTSTPKK